MRTWPLLATFFVFVAAAWPASAQQTLQSVEREIVSKWQSVRSMIADIESVTKLRAGPQEVQTTVKGKLEVMRTGQAAMYRQESTARTVMKMGAQEQTVDATVVTVSDGRHLYNMQRVEPTGPTNATRQLASRNNLLTGGAELFGTLSADFACLLAEDAEVDGDTCWVIRARPNRPPPSPAAPRMLVFYLRQKDGLLVKMEGLNAAGQPQMTTHFRNAQFNAEIKPDRFKFEVPPGVTLVDLTGDPTPFGGWGP